jgi:hypothetical protein
MRVNDYSFGRIRINNKEYAKDVILSQDKLIVSRWYRKEGHNVHLEDIEEILNAKPEVVVFGTGYSGIMKVSRPVMDELNQRKIEVIQQPTGQAVKTFNDLVDKGKRVVLAAHLTC